MNIYIKTSLKIVVVVILVFEALSYLLTKKVDKHYSDDELRQTALSRNMSTVPTTYKELLKVVDSPENRLSKDKIELGKNLFF